MDNKEVVKRIQEMYFLCGTDEECGITDCSLCRKAKDIAIQALEEIQAYRELEQRLKSVYGENDGLLETIVNGLVKYEKAPNTTPDNSELLTDDDVDRWHEYKALGTVEELKALKEKDVAKKPRFYANNYHCIECGNLVGNNEFGWQRFLYCDKCGQKLDWE